MSIRILVPVKRVVDFNAKVRVKPEVIHRIMHVVFEPDMSGGLGLTFFIGRGH